MNKKKLVAGLLASASVLGICLSGGTAFAAVQEEDTTVGIGFKDHLNPPPPPGDLSIQWLPKAFKFGEAHDVDTVTKSYPIDDTSEKYVVINDSRADATGQKWILTAKLSEMKSATHRLKGAKLNFTSTKMAYDGGTAHPDTSNVVAPRAEHTAVAATGTLSLDEGGTTPVEVMHDDGDTNASSFKGKTATQLGGIELEVVGSTAVEKQSYTGTVTWSLDDTI